MANIKCSFVTTVYNEEKTIARLLTSLLNQTKLPDEIVVVDAGSIDNTLLIISKYKTKFLKKKIKMQVIIKEGNRSIGRNEAIKNASYELILCSDSGCFLDKDWLKCISLPFYKKSIDVVSGFYKPVTHNVFEKCLSTYTCVYPDKVKTGQFLPSSRSVAFRKNAWKKEGGYPEYLDTCEDLIFARDLKRLGCTFLFVPEAFVYWPQRKTIFDAFWQFYSYARGDGMAHYFRPQTPFLFIRYIFIASIIFWLYIHPALIVLYIILILFFLYILWAIVKNYAYVKKISSLFFLPTLQFVSDIAVITGTTHGVLESFIKKFL